MIAVLETFRRETERELVSALKGRGFIVPLPQMTNTAAWADECLLYIEEKFAETTDAAITLEKGPHVVTYFTECGLGSVEDSTESYLRCVEDMLALAEREGHEPKSGPICEEICRFSASFEPSHLFGVSSLPTRFP